MGLEAAMCSASDVHHKTKPAVFAVLADRKKPFPVTSVHHHVHFKPSSYSCPPSSPPVRASPLQLTAWDSPLRSAACAVLNGVAFVPPSCRILRDPQQVLLLQTLSCQSPI